MSIRRISLPPGHTSVLDLKPGEVSPVLVDPNGYFIYRLRSKGILSLDQARSEIREILCSQRAQTEMRNVIDSETATFDEGYFAQ